MTPPAQRGTARLQTQDKTKDDHHRGTPIHRSICRRALSYQPSVRKTPVIDLTPPPIAFATGEQYTSPLHVYWFEPTGQWFLFDHRGFLCRTDDLADVARLVKAEARKSPNIPGRKFYWPKARDEVYPGWSEENEAKMIENERALDQYREQQKAKRLSRKGEQMDGLTGTDILAKLGLGQEKSSS